MMQAVGLVMLGGALGAAARYLITHAFSEMSSHRGFPIGTLLVNVFGSFAVGYVLTWSADHTHDRWRLLAATGFCGGFTTFSAFAYESMAYLHSGRMLLLVLNVGLNNVLSLGALVLGIALHNGTSTYMMERQTETLPTARANIRTSPLESLDELSPKDCSRQ
jgi:CrcB protein